MRGEGLQTSSLRGKKIRENQKPERLYGGFKFGGEI